MMKKVRYYLRKTWPGLVLSKCKRWIFEKYILSKTIRTEIKGVKLNIGEIEGVKLNVRSLDLNMKLVILYYKTYEAPEITICKKIISPNERILEIGAAIGFVGLFCLTRLKAKTVVSVEPNPVTLKQLRINYELNGMAPKIIEAAIADEDKTVNFHTSPDFWTDSTFASSENQRSNLIEVKAMSLSSILSMANEQFTALILDVEGSETLLDWSQLPSSISKLILEIHPDSTGHAEADRVLNEVLNSGFHVVDQQANVFGLLKNSQ
jgi:FkbM family methyltransferase